MSNIKETPTKGVQAQQLLNPDRKLPVIDVFKQRYERVLDEIFKPLERAAKLTGTLANKHPKGSRLALAGIGLATFIAWIAIGDPIKDHLPIVKNTQVTLTNSGDNTLTSETILLPSKDVQVTSLTDKPIEKFDYSGWKTFPGPGFSLRYPNQEGWRVVSNGIVLGADGDEGVKISATSQALKGKSFAQFVEEQYTNNQKNRLDIVTSQPANFPAWKAAGVDGEVIGYEARLRPDGKKYYERIFMAYINGWVFQFIVSQEISQGEEIDSVVNRTLGSLQIAGTTKAK